MACQFVCVALLYIYPISGSGWCQPLTDRCVAAAFKLLYLPISVFHSTKKTLCRLHRWRCLGAWWMRVPITSFLVSARLPPCVLPAPRIFCFSFFYSVSFLRYSTVNSCPAETVDQSHINLNVTVSRARSNPQVPVVAVALSLFLGQEYCPVIGNHNHACLT